MPVARHWHGSRLSICRRRPAGGRGDAVLGGSLKHVSSASHGLKCSSHTAVRVIHTLYRALYRVSNDILSHYILIQSQEFLLFLDRESHTRRTRFCVHDYQWSPFTDAGTLSDQSHAGSEQSRVPARVGTRRRWETTPWCSSTGRRPCRRNSR